MLFAQKGFPLSVDDFSAATKTIAITDAAMWAVIEVETAGVGFLESRKPIILFERHKFSHKTQGKWDQSHPDISNPQWGGYGPAGEHQYIRLNEALNLNEDAALASASWGVGQVMGEHWQDLGYDSIQHFVGEMCASEGGQLKAMSQFIQKNRLAAPLARGDWTDFARSYNGPAFEQNQYDLKLKQHYEKLLVGPLPDLRLRTCQLNLTYLSKSVSPTLSPGGVDGWMGRRTRSAIQAFQQQFHLPVTGDLDDTTYAAISQAANPAS